MDATSSSQALPGLCVHDIMLLPIERLRSLFDSIELPAPLDEATDLLMTEIRARLKFLSRRRARLPDARPPVAHAVGRRSAADQPHHGARHVAGQHPVRARRAVDRPASARHEPGHRRHAAAARRRQLAGRRRARSAGDVRRRQGHRHRARARRARRRDRLQRTGGGNSSGAADPDRRLHRAAQGRCRRRSRRRSVAATPRLLLAGRARAQPQGHRRRDPARRGWSA